jgi:hypothetical protein
MKVINYDEWQDTALIVHIVTQIMGKVKLARTALEPEWQNSLLDFTYDGYTTGLIPFEESKGSGEQLGFQVDYKLTKDAVTAIRTDNVNSSFMIEDGDSIAKIYGKFMTMLERISVPTEIVTRPQEMAHKIPFDEDKEMRKYESARAKDYFAMSLFAYSALREFSARFRCKKINSRYFWGTFDTTTVLFGGEDKPFSGDGVIEKVAFAESLIEFGFWPGDEAVTKPMFFILPYPFATIGYSDSQIEPADAFYSAEKNEFFVSLEDILKHDDPKAALLSFFNSGYKAMAEGEKWKSLEWFEKKIV